MRAACSARARSACSAVHGQRRQVADVARQGRGRPPAGGRRAGRGARGSRSPRRRGRTGRRGASPRAAARRCAASRARPDCPRAARPHPRARCRRTRRPDPPARADAPATHTRASRASSCSMTRQHGTASASARVRATSASAARGSCSCATARLTRGRASPPDLVLAALEEPLQVAAQEPPLSAGRAAARHDARVGPASQGVFTHLQHLGCGSHPQPATAAVQRRIPLSDSIRLLSADWPRFYTRLCANSSASRVAAGRMPPGLATPPAPAAAAGCCD